MLMVPPAFGPQLLNCPGTNTGKELGGRCARKVIRTLSAGDCARTGNAARASTLRARDLFTQSLRLSSMYRIRRQSATELVGLHFQRTYISPCRYARNARLRPPPGQRLFFVVTLLFPVVFFVLLELGLRWSGYGPDLSLFITDVQNGKQYHLMNPEVKSRYFYRVPFSPSTSPDYFLVPKPAGTFRIFCLGGSTTVGFPYYYNTSFSSFLRDRLRRLFPRAEDRGDQPGHDRDEQLHHPGHGPRSGRLRTGPGDRVRRAQ